MIMKRAIIWDLDGTIIDSESHHWEAWKVIMAAESFSITYEEYVSDFGRRNDEILRLRMSPDLTDSEISRLIVGEGGGLS
jgi:beta-phosphoglucomutase-like phosphatase (HAD superfamily)